jgi:hypothetical protein
MGFKNKTKQNGNQQYVTTQTTISEINKPLQSNGHLRNITNAGGSHNTITIAERQRRWVVVILAIQISLRIKMPNLSNHN